MCHFIRQFGDRIIEMNSTCVWLHYSANSVSLSASYKMTREIQLFYVWPFRSNNSTASCPKLLTHCHKTLSRAVADVL